MTDKYGLTEEQFQRLCEAFAELDEVEYEGDGTFDPDREIVDGRVGIMYSTGDFFAKGGEPFEEGDGAPMDGSFEHLELEMQVWANIKDRTFEYEVGGDLVHVDRCESDEEFIFFCENLTFESEYEACHDYGRMAFYGDGDKFGWIDTFHKEEKI